MIEIADYPSEQIVSLTEKLHAIIETMVRAGASRGDAIHLILDIGENLLFLEEIQPKQNAGKP